MEEALVTVIVPIYNGEKTIERCLCSIRNQTYKNLEVIVVNDGSTDHTDQILRKFEETDLRFRVIRKENTGVSDSRNAAIMQARGKYLQFVDGDDWIVSDATRSFVEAAEEKCCDMVISDFSRVVGHMVTHKGDIPVSGSISRKQYAEYMMKAPANFYYGVLWNKFFRTDIVREQGLLCSTQLDWCEDFQFNMEYLKYARNIFVLQKPLYYYVKTKGSLVDTKIDFAVTVRTKRILFDYYKELYQSLDLYEKNKLRIQTFFIDFARDKRRKEDTARLAWGKDENINSVYRYRRRA